MKVFIGLILLLAGHCASAAPKGVATPAAPSAVAVVTPPPPVRVLVSVGELTPKDLAWRKEACANIHKIGNAIVTQGVQVSCRQDPLHVIDTYLQQLKADNEYHIRLLRGFKGSYRLSISHWNRKMETDFTTLGWNIGLGPHTAPLKDAALSSIIANFFSYLETEEAQKTEWLLNGRWHSETISFDFKSSTFRSVKDKRRLTVNEATRLFAEESPQHADYIRTRQEIALVNSIKSPGLNIFTPQDSLLTILERAAQESRHETLYWQRVVYFDERSLSLLTIQLLDAATTEVPAVEVLRQSPEGAPSFAPNLPAAKGKKTSGRLIYLF